VELGALEAVGNGDRVVRSVTRSDGEMRVESGRIKACLHNPRGLGPRGTTGCVAGATASRASTTR
jgi:hypothetical protein